MLVILRARQGQRQTVMLVILGGRRDKLGMGKRLQAAHARSAGWVGL